jgi:SPP1 family predicted phage head-tail adaptor
MLDSGKLDYQATIQTPTEGVNSIGEPTLSWSTFATRWVAIEPLSGSEQVANMVSQGTTTHRVKLRYTPGLKPNMRLVADGRTFEITSVVETGRRVGHELLVTELVD